MTNLQVRDSSKASFDVTKRTAPFQERGFAFETFPIGWFQVGWSDEFPIGQAKALSYFGDHQVAFRGESGTLYVFDAFCPHLGGHLGYGGTFIDGDGLVLRFMDGASTRRGQTWRSPYSRLTVTVGR